MKQENRIDDVLKCIEGSSSPVSGNFLAYKYNLSRQIIVKYIATLRNRGHEIISTTKGYILYKKPDFERTFKVVHSDNDTEKELLAIVNAGGTVKNVFVWHKIYGKIEAELNITTPDDVTNYIKTLNSGRSKLLKKITNEYHYHIVSAEDEETLDKVEKILRELNYFIDEE